MYPDIRGRKKLMRVSICIPTVNRIKYLRETITSVAAQTFRDFEIIISDNSADKDYNRQVEQIVASFPDLSFRLFHQSKMLSATDNANFLIEYARGEYWLYLPDDDRMCSEYLASSIGALDKHRQAAFSFTDHWIINADGIIDPIATSANSKRYRRNELQSGLIPYERLFRLALYQSFTVQTMLLRREIVERYRFLVARDPVGDFDFPLRLASSDESIHAYYINRRLIEYRVHSGQGTGSMSTGTASTCRSVIASLENLKNIPSADRSLYCRKLAARYLTLAVSETMEGNRRLADKYLRKSIFLSPTFIKAYLYVILLRLPKNTISWMRNTVSRYRVLWRSGYYRGRKFLVS
jgi:glycosyltransferase involved in cell wall biosynthesis